MLLLYALHTNMQAAMQKQTLDLKGLLQGTLNEGGWRFWCAGGYNRGGTPPVRRASTENSRRLFSAGFRGVHTLNKEPDHGRCFLIAPEHTQTHRVEVVRYVITQYGNNNTQTHTRHKESRKAGSDRGIKQHRARLGQTSTPAPTHRCLLNRSAAEPVD